MRGGIKDGAYNSIKHAMKNVQNEKKEWAPNGAPWGRIRRGDGGGGGPGVAFRVKCAYSCILGAFDSTWGATRPARGVLETPGGGGGGGGPGLKLKYTIHSIHSKKLGARLTIEPAPVDCGAVPEPILISRMNLLPQV